MNDDCANFLVPLIAVVDDDESVRESLPELLRSFQFEVCAFSSAEDFLSSEAVRAADCLILDVAMPTMSGLELQRQLNALQYTIPIVFITAQADSAARARILETGAIDCLLKPFSADALLSAVDKALKSR